MSSLPHGGAIRKPFIEHLNELRRRLLICALFVGAGAGIGYSLNQELLRIIQQPLGEKLFFTSPTGGFNFIFMICISFGVLVALPCIIYQSVAFLKPMLPQTSRFKMTMYPVYSVVLACCGIAFAYFLSLPAALKFLTNFGGANIEALITTDTYFNFAFAYLVGFAVLFQLPLLLLIINRITPLTPGKLMKSQRYVLVGSFIVAAILTPTPDPINQLMMAGPIVVLYQLSIILVWIINRKNRKARAFTISPARTPASQTSPSLQSASQTLSIQSPAAPRLVFDIVPPSRTASFPPKRQTPVLPRKQINDFQVARPEFVRPRNLIDIMAN